jgi:hypothetical protein
MSGKVNGIPATFEECEAASRMMKRHQWSIEQDMATLERFYVQPQPVVLGIMKPRARHYDL